MKFTLKDEKEETVTETERRLKRSTIKSILVVLAILAVIAVVAFLASCSTPDNDVIDQAIAARIYNKQ